jgi:tRNA nucleotidyltransferase (CCA-adding enzyme)
VPLLAVYAVFRLTPSEAQRRPLWQYATHWRNLYPVTDGDRLRRMGIPPSPLYRPVLKALRDAWLDGLIHSAQEEDALLSRLLAGQGLQPDGESHG